MDEAEETVFRFSHFAMGTTFELLVAGRREEYARQVSQAVFGEVDRIERLFSRFNPGSEISQINRLRPGESLRIGVETYQCLQTTYWVYSRTKGAFDINVGSLAKYKKDTARAGRRRRRDILKQLILSKAPHGFMVTRHPAKKKGEAWVLDLDLGGMGKGYALDKTVDILRDWGIEQALIHGGTSTALAVGVPPDKQEGKEGWPVGIGGDWECPRVPREFLLRDRGLSGSGTEVKGEHIFDPRTGKPAERHLAAWVSHPSAAVSDALSTAFMAMSTKEVRNFCKKHPEVWAMVVVGHRSCEVFNEDVADS